METKEALELPCVLERVISNNGNGFSLLAVNLNPESSIYKVSLEDLIVQEKALNKWNNMTVTCSGDITEDCNGQQFVFVGNFMNHPKFGKQFKCEFYYKDIPTTEDGFRYFLMSLPNIKDARSLDIIKTFGVAETIRILDCEPEKLIEINGLTKKRVEAIKKSWDQDKTLRELYLFLAKHGIEHKLIKKIYKEFGANSIKIISENPYKLCDVRGIGFSTADLMAHKIVKNISKSERLKACMLYLLGADIKSNSNLCMPLNTMRSQVEKLIGECNTLNGISDPVKDYVSNINNVIKANLDKFSALHDIKANSTYVYLDSVLKREKYIVDELHKRTKDNDSALRISDEDMNWAENDILKFSGRKIVLDCKQKEAIKSAFENKVTVMTGGGGTGKSTICRCIFALAQEKGFTVRLMSPTGKAAKVLSKKTGYNASTIHRSLGLKPGNEYPKNQINEDIVILDESSMIGIDTMFPVMLALSNNKHANVIFVGDSNQLPSVSAGNFLFDIMKANIASVVKLDVIHRQGEHSYISLLANEIANGKVVEVPKNADDIEWNGVSDTEEFVGILLRKLEKLEEEGIDIKDLQLLSPMYKGDCGVNAINTAIQTMMSEKNGTSTNFANSDFKKFYVGDRVMQTENNYSKEIFNGDMGYVKEIGRKVLDSSSSDKAENYLVVDFDGLLVTYKNDEIEELILAWCCTIHKFQGSQAPYILFVIVNEAHRMLNKELVYTGMTRAEKYLYLYGQISEFRGAPMSSAIRTRYTNVNNLFSKIKNGDGVVKILESDPKDFNRAFSMDIQEKED